MSRLQGYTVPVVLSVGFVLLSPLGLFVIFLSGDSCCGENTSGTMIAVTAGIVTLLAIVALMVNGVLKVTVKRDAPDFRVVKAALITAGPAAVIYVVLVTVISATAF
jgi:hypothetical protein